MGILDTPVKCRVSGDNLKVVLNLGNQYITDFPPIEESTKIPQGLLRIGVSEKSGLIQLMDSFDQDSLYRRYWYRSCINESMKLALTDVVLSAKKWVSLKDNDVVLDVASNDGTLFQNYNSSIMKIGNDPSNI
jgi:hypothetical protein